MAATQQSRTLLKVLIVEDNRDIRTTLRMMLSMAYGHVVFEAEDGASGVQTALDEKPDVALIDLGLPDVTGLEVARRIRAKMDKDAILLIALTGYGTPEDQHSTREAGFDIHLVKPVETHTLAAILEKRVRSKAHPGLGPGRSDST